MARRNAVRIKIDGIKDVEGRLAAVGLTLRSPEVTREIQRGAEVMAARARSRAPSDTGKLRQGIYTASTERNGFVALTRKGQRINSPLRFPPRRGQVVVVSSVFYGLFVERGRKRRKGVGRQRAQRFFRVGVKEAQPVASAYILRRLEKLVQERWNAGYWTGAR
ncbi:MAG: HK97 gp10 family phage protein [Caldilinea sp.]|nr:HK97 gp10 family phage protein [Caldilinea sp.]MCB0147159.1 HK97 gp10 family phage protein [Caldilineaceae bacterium]